MKNIFYDCLEIHLLSIPTKCLYTCTDYTLEKRLHPYLTRAIRVQDQATKMTPLLLFVQNYHTKISTIISESDFYINSYDIQHIIGEHILIISLYLFGIPSSNLGLLYVIFKSKQQ